MCKAIIVALVCGIVLACGATPDDEIPIAQPVGSDEDALTVFACLENEEFVVVCVDEETSSDSGNTAAFGEEGGVGVCEGKDAREEDVEESAPRESAAPDVAAESAAPDVAAAAKKRDQRAWLLMPARAKQECLKLRKRIDNSPNPKTDVFSRGWRILPDDPSLHPASVCPDPMEWTLRPINIWIPYVLFPDICSRIKCPFCESYEGVRLSSARWAGAPRRVLCAVEYEYLDTKSLQCTKCARRFRCTHPHAVRLM